MTLDAAPRDVHHGAARRDTSAATLASVDKRRRSRAERVAVEEFAASVGLLSDATVAQLTHLLLAHCQLRGLPVPEL